MLCALSAVLLGACSQHNAAFTPGDTSGDTSGAASSAAAPNPVPTLPAVARRASTLVGLPVRSPSGARLGAVLDIVFDDGGAPSHLILVHAIAGGAPGRLSPVPWALAIKHLHDGALVLKTKRFAEAPGFAPGDWPKLAERHWSAAADAYWTRTAEPAFIPIDSTSRKRPTMKL